MHFLERAATMSAFALRRRLLQPEQAGPIAADIGGPEATGKAATSKATTGDDAPPVAEEAERPSRRRKLNHGQDAEKEPRPEERPVPAAPPADTAAAAAPVGRTAGEPPESRPKKRATLRTTFQPNKLNFEQHGNGAMRLILSVEEVRSLLSATHCLVFLRASANTFIAPSHPRELWHRGRAWQSHAGRSCLVAL